MNKLSRRKLVSNFMLGNKSAEHYLPEMKQQCHPIHVAISILEAYTYRTANSP
jgi:hypothetical protein